MYIRKRYVFEESIEIEEGHSGRYGAPGHKRQRRKKPTPEQIAKQNQFNKEKNIRRLIKWNFQENDYWVTLTYQKSKRPESMEKAKDDIQRFLRKLRKLYKDAGSQLKYILCTEIGSRGGVHHHIIINRITDGDAIIARCWGAGRCHIELMYIQGNFRELANYIGKQPKDEKSEKRYTRSRNLIVKKPEKKVMFRTTWNEEPRVPNGYYLDKESLFEGINPVTGYRYRHYTIVKLKRRE